MVWVKKKSTVVSVETLPTRTGGFRSIPILLYRSVEKHWSLNAGVACFKFHFNKQQRLAGIDIDIKYQIMTNQLGMF